MHHSRWHFLILILILILIVFSCRFISSVASATPDPIQILGPHTPLFTLKKNKGPKNQMIIYSRTDEQCRFLPNSGNARLFFDLYWLINGVQFKPVHAMIKSATRDKLRLLTRANDLSSFTIRFHDFSEIDPRVKDPIIKVQSQKTAKGCDTQATLILESATGAKPISLKLESIYAEAHPSFRLPYFYTLDAVTFSGKDPTTQKPVTLRYAHPERESK